MAALMGLEILHDGGAPTALAHKPCPSRPTRPLPPFMPSFARPNVKTFKLEARLQGSDGGGGQVPHWQANLTRALGHGREVLSRTIKHPWSLPVRGRTVAGFS